MSTQPLLQRTAAKRIALPVRQEPKVRSLLPSRLLSCLPLSSKSAFNDRRTDSACLLLQVFFANERSQPCPLLLLSKLPQCPTADPCLRRCFLRRPLKQPTSVGAFFSLLSPFDDPIVQREDGLLSASCLSGRDPRLITILFPRVRTRMHFAVVLGGLAVGLLNFGDKVRLLYPVDSEGK